MLLWKSGQPAHGGLTGGKTEGGSHLTLPLSHSMPTYKTQLSAFCQDHSLWRRPSQLLHSGKGKGKKRRLQIKMEGGEIHETRTNINIRYYSFVMSLGYHSVSHLPDQPDMNNRAQDGADFLCCLWIRYYQTWSALPLFEISPASGQVQTDWIWRGTPWLNIKKVWNLTSSFVYMFNGTCSWYIMNNEGFFSLDLHPLQSFGTCAITNCSICKRSKCGCKATQLSISIKLLPLTCLLSHQ